MLGGVVEKDLRGLQGAGVRARPVHKQAIVADVADLAWDCDALLVICAHGGIEAHRLVGIAPLLGVQQHGTNHQPCSALAGLAVDYRNVLAALLQPLLHIPAEMFNHLKWGCIVVVKRKDFHSSMEFRRVVAPLRAEIVDLVVVLVEMVQEAKHLGGGVAVGRLHVFRREAHGDDVGRDVGQVQVKPIFFVNESALPFRDFATHKGRHGGELERVGGGGGGVGGGGV
mmetsp:Transcript_8259/g.20820  ORF Transcript_8259/g.20820 Transcript_8259/m.20820 type:complete len:227 (+) Transcript_8259:793-1473(+)